MANNVAIRLAVGGDAEAKAQFENFKRDGQSAFAGVGDIAEGTAKRVTNSFNRAVDDAEAANARLAAAAAKIAAIAPKSAVQMQIEASSGSNARGGVVEQSLGGRNGVQYEGSAKASAAVFQAAAAEQERYAATAEKVRAALFPTWQAQRQLNLELHEAKEAYRAGALSADHYTMEEHRLRQAMDQLTTSGDRQTASLGQRKAGLQQLGFQIQDVNAQAMAGTNGLLILAQQGGQVAQAIDLIGPSGKLGAFAAFMGGPYGAILLAAVSIGGVLISSLLKTGDAADKAKSAKVSLTDATADLNRATGQSVLSHEAEVRASVNVARAAFREEVDKRNLTVTTLNLAKARLVAASAANAGQISPEGGINVAGAAEAVAARQVVSLNKQILEQEKGIGKAREAYRGVRVDELLRGAEERADKGVAATRRYESSIYNLRQQLAKGKIDEAAFNIGADKAIAVRDAATKSTRGAGAAAVSAAGDDARLATANSATAKATAQLAITRREGSAAVRAGTLSQADYQQRLEAGMNAVNRAREADKAAGQGRRDLARDTRELAAAMDALEAKLDPEAAGRKQQAKTDSVIAAIEKRSGSDVADRYRIADRRERWQKEEAELTAQIQKTLPDLGFSANVEIVPKFDVDKAIAGLDLLGQKGSGVKGMMGDLRGSALRFVDTLDPADWESWGNSGKSVISMVKGELLKLALINPLKNLLSGGSALPTIASSLTKFAGLFGGGGSPLSFAGNATAGVSSSISAASSIAPIGFNAAGTQWWSGGATWVGENGPEIINAPRGARIANAGQARQMVAANDQPRSLRIEVVKGDMFDVKVSEIAAPIASGYAQQAIVGGSAMAQDQSARAARRRLG